MFVALREVLIPQRISLEACEMVWDFRTPAAQLETWSNFVLCLLNYKLIIIVCIYGIQNDTIYEFNVESLTHTS